MDQTSRASHEVLLLIDEFATFGRLPLIEKLMAAVRGYRARIMIVCQALSQLDDIYGVAGRNALLGNATRHVFMPNPDPATSSYVSHRIGDTTMNADTRSRTSGLNHGRVSTSRASIVRTFLKPEEFERLPAGRALLLAPGAPPFRMRVRGWFKHRSITKRFIAAPTLTPIDIGGPMPPFRAERDPVRNSVKRDLRTPKMTQGQLFSRYVPATDPPRTSVSDPSIPNDGNQMGLEIPSPSPAQIIEDVDSLDATEANHREVPRDGLSGRPSR